ncbi:MAG: DUF503 domain-containing protein [Anaerolineales bacterium]|nr:MAG: DUF503 domain-containing protein [Anaerolineales bacterium]
MMIGACTVQLYLPGVFSLKEKRSRLKPILIDLHRRFNVAAVEIDNQDVWQSASIAIVAVANESTLIYSVLEKAVHWIDENRFDVEIVDWIVELR